MTCAYVSDLLFGFALLVCVGFSLGWLSIWV